jgi:hypothetical protein
MKRKSLTSAWRRSISSTKTSETPSRAYNSLLSMEAEAAAVDMAAAAFEAAEAVAFEAAAAAFEAAAVEAAALAFEAAEAADLAAAAAEGAAGAGAGAAAAACRGEVAPSARRERLAIALAEAAVRPRFEQAVRPEISFVALSR